MPKFRRKPIVIEAEQLVDGCYDTMLRHFGEAPGEKYGYIVGTRHPAGPVSGMLSASKVDGFELWITTIEGQHIARPGDWIIKDNGKFYPIKEEIFLKTYEPA